MSHEAFEVDRWDYISPNGGIFVILAIDPNDGVPSVIASTHYEAVAAHIVNTHNELRKRT